MADLKPIVIKVKPKSVPNGLAFKWVSLTEQMPTFTRDIVTPDLGIDKDGNSTVNIGAIVSGMPTIFARANMFKLALNYVTDDKEETSGLLSFYSSLKDEWRGLISCLALDYANVDVKRINLKYSDNNPITKTVNIYEPKGAFGNMLFERKPLWCDQGLAQNEEKVPFIDVIKYKGQVIGGTSPESLLFSGVSYSINEKLPFVNVKNNRFTDPLNSELTQDELNKLYGYVQWVINNINKFVVYYTEIDKKIQPQFSNVDANLRNWLNQMTEYANRKGYRISGTDAPPVDVFKRPFSLVFNYSTELWGSEGQLSETPQGLANPILFNPRDLLLSKEATDIVCINFGNEAAKSPDFLINQPIYVLKADTKGMPGMYHYFALPLSAKGLNVFGKTIGALVGLDNQSAVKSRLTALYDPSVEYGNLTVKLTLFTIDNKEKALEQVYTVGATPIKGNDILIWPNFISKQWNRYFMFSELPHNVSTPEAPFKAVPFVGDVSDDFFRILVDENEEPVYCAKDGTVAVPSKYVDRLKVRLHVVSDNRVSDNRYKYEIYESNQPFKGVKLVSGAGRDSGFVIIRYSTQSPSLPVNLLQQTKDLSEANLGVDFGSTNSSVAYFSKRDNRVMDQLVLKNRRVSLFSSDLKDNDKRPAVEDEIFFFQNDEIRTNSIKSIMTIHDQKRLVPIDSAMAAGSREGEAVSGGFPCFEKNLPIQNATANRYILNYPRSGVVDIVHNMKWSNQAVENSYKKAYLGSLLLHVYAQLFEEGHYPVTLKWSYPSSMGTNLIGQYIQIWDNLGSINPIVGGNPMSIHKPSISINTTGGANVWGSSGGDSAWGSSGATAAPAADVWGTPAPAPVASGWGAASTPGTNPALRDIEITSGPIKFDFEPLKNDESITEALAVANFIVNQSNVNNSPEYLTLSFDVGGSTTDISALCYMNSSRGPGLAMVKQNSIRFAAQRVAHATKSSPNFREVLLEMCQRKGISVQGLNVEPFTFKPETAHYYFEQIVDRLDEHDFPVFYELIRGKCPELMSVNIYVTGLIMYYAGQLSQKLIAEISRSEDKLPGMENWKPRVNVVFAGKGARIFDWFSAVDKDASDKYYGDLFIAGFGGEDFARQALSGPPIINPTNQGGTSNIKYEVSKGLAYPTASLLVPKNPTAIEILGEEGYIVMKSTGERVRLEYNHSVTSEMMENLGLYFMHSPEPGAHCKKFMDFAGIFYQVATAVFGLKMTPDEFKNGFQTMNIDAYIRTMPEYYAAVEEKQKGAKFDFVAPIIILEGMKFYDDVLLKGIARQ